MEKLNTLCLSIAFAFLIGLSAYGQEVEKDNSIHLAIQQHTDDIFDDLVEIRRDFHVHPEVSEKEERTAKKIEEYLLSLGLEVKTNIGGYGVVGILHGDKAGKNIAWRADIDAMPSDIPDVVDFESVNKGVRHICGHDVHTTVALGIANVLTHQKEDLRGTVYFVFQPSEENYKGAKAMIDDELLNIINPEEIYGIHTSPFPVGTIATKPESIFAHTNRVKVVYKKTGNEEAKTNFTKELISGFQNVEAESKFWDWENLGDPEIGIENPNTVFTNFFTVKENFGIENTEDQLIITAITESSNKEQLDTFLKDVKQKLAESQYSADLESVDFIYEKVVVINDVDLTNESVNSITEIYGDESFIPLYGVITANRGDDFAYFQKTIPGVYYFLGTANYETGVNSMPHAPNFAVDEESIRLGVKYFSSMIVERGKGGDK